MSASDGERENDARVLDEVEALRAIYGDECVSYDAVRRALSVQLRRDCCLAMMLPTSYPSDSRPLNVTLRAMPLSRADSSEVVADALTGFHEERPGFGECIFDYCQLVLDCFTTKLSNREKVDREKQAAGASGLGTRHPHSDIELLAGRIVIHGQPLVDRKSIFQAHASKISSVGEACAFTEFLISKFPKLSGSTHNIMAYRVGCAQDFDDDGEHSAGKGMLFILQQLGVDNVVVVVSRFFGGVKLGPIRFKHINNVTRQLLVDHGFV